MLPIKKPDKMAEILRMQRCWQINMTAGQIKILIVKNKPYLKILFIFAVELHQNPSSAIIQRGNDGIKTILFSHRKRIREEAKGRLKTHHK